MEQRRSDDDARWGEQAEEGDEQRRDAEADKRADTKLSTADLARGGDDAERTSASGTEAEGTELEPLFADQEADELRTRWRDIQGQFVDQPRKAVEEGDALVATLMQRLAVTFSEERSHLEQQWDRDGDVSTEDLRVALQRYRSFFDRLLSA